MVTLGWAIHSFIYSKHLFSNYYAQGNDLGTGHTVVNKALLALEEF